MPLTIRSVVPLVVLAILWTQPSPAARPHLTPWSAPANMGPVVNSDGYDSMAALSKDGLSLYISTSRGNGLGTWDIWVCQRENQDDPWGEPRRLPDGVNTPSYDMGPAFSRDGHWMFFISDRPGGYGGYDVWASWRRHVDDDFGWEPPVNLGPAINTSADDNGVTVWDGDRHAPAELYFNSNRTGSQEVYVSRLERDGGWTPAELVPELNSPASEGKLAITFDGREIYFHSNREGSVLGNDGKPSVDIWVSHRESPSAPWETPVNVAEVNTPYSDAQLGLAPDGHTLMFTSNRPDPAKLGPTDLYVSDRDKVIGKRCR